MCTLWLVTAMPINSWGYNRPLPSQCYQWWFLLRLRDLLADLRSGLLWQFQKTATALATGTADVQLVVGDVFALFMAASQSDIPIVFFPTAKSERAIPHYGIELKYIRSKASLVFPRDEATHQRFLNAGIPSRYFGNPMFDAMTSNVERGLPMTIALLPGSRSGGHSKHGLDVNGCFTIDIG